jgi:hypothetical protein
VAIASLSVTAQAQAGGASHHVSKALAHSLEAVAHTTVAGMKVVSGAVALPLVIVGEIGQVSGDAGEELWEEANRPIGEPLVISDEVVTAGPAPREAMDESKQENTP